MKQRRTLSVSSFYRLQTRDEQSKKKMESSLKNTGSLNDGYFVKGRHFNIGSIQWELYRYTIISALYHRILLTLMLDLGLEQMVRRPSKGTNMLTCSTQTTEVRSCGQGECYKCVYRQTNGHGFLDAVSRVCP